MKKILTNKKFVIIAIAVLIIVAITSRLLSGNKPKYNLATVKRDNIIQTVASSGKLKSENQIDLKFQSSGLLAWVGVKEGDTVKKWQAIASLDKRQLQNDIKKKLLAYMSERQSFDQTQDTYIKDRNNPTLTDAEKRILQEAQFNLDSSIIDVETSDLAKRLATITSPIDGIITHLEYSVPGENVTSTTLIATVVSPEKMVFEANIDEGDIAGVFINQRAKITVDAYPDEVFEGTVSKISFASTVTSGGGTAFPVEISIPGNDNFKFKIGMNGDAELIAKEENNVLVIPSRSIFQLSGKSNVWKVVNDRLTKQEIIMGIDNGEITQIKSGLDENDRVLEEVTSKIKGGERI